MPTTMETLSTPVLAAAPCPNGHPQAAAPAGNGQHAPANGLPAAIRQLLCESSPERGPSLKAQILITLGQRDDCTQGELIKALEHVVPDELVTEGTNPRRGLLLVALRDLEVEGRINRAGKRDDDLVSLVVPAPDPRFELDADLHAVIPPASAEEDAALERQLVIYGCLGALILWQEGERSLLVDGYRRLTLCLRHGLPYEVTWRPFRDRTEVVRFLWETHRGRRNLTREARGYAIGRLFNAARLAHGGDRHSGRSRSHSAELVRTAQGLAESLNVGRATLFRDGRFAEALDRITAVCGPRLRTAVLCRTVKLSRRGVGRLASLDEHDMQQQVLDWLEGRLPAPRPALRQARLPLIGESVHEWVDSLLEQEGWEGAKKFHALLGPKLDRSKPAARD